jgi:hypothetical protein
MADDTTGGAAGASGTTNTTQSPAGNASEPAAAGDIKAILAKNDELLAELKRTKGALKKFEDAHTAADEAKKREEGKFTELLADKDKQLNELRSSLRQQEIKGLCRDAGIIDPDYHLILAQQIEFDADGKPTNADTIITALKTSKPFLFQAPSAASKPGTSPFPPAGFHGGSAGTFTREQIKSMSPEEYSKNRDAIQRAAQAGAIK